METLPPLGLIRARIEFGLNGLRRYFSFVESKLAWAEVEEQHELDEVRQILIDMYGDDPPTDADVELLQERWGCDDPDFPVIPYSPLHDDFPRCLNYSFITLVVLVFESELRVLCDALALHRKLPKPSGNWNQAVIRCAHDFLTDAIGVRTVMGRTWTDLHDLYTVRNCIAHVGGRINGFRKCERLEILSRRGIGLSIQQPRQVEPMLVVHKCYCSRVVEDVWAFFTTIFDELGIEPCDSESLE